MGAVPFDVDRLETTGTATPVVEGVAVMQTAGAAQYALSENGTLVFVPENARALQARRLGWLDRSGKEERLRAEPRSYRRPRLSPDGTRLAVEDFSGSSDIWAWDFGRETLTRLTFSSSDDRYAVWAPDGQRIAFASTRDGNFNLYWSSADGTGKVERLTEGSLEHRPLAFTRDMKHLVYQERHPPNGWDLLLLSLEEGSSEPLLDTRFDQHNAALSPDGRFIAYQSNESGENAIYVRPFPNVDEGRWQVSTGWGLDPAWSADGRELYYLARSGLAAATIATEPAFAVVRRDILFESTFAAVEGRDYDVGPDGRFLFVLSEDGQGSERSEIYVVLDWFDELERLVPTH